MTADPHSDSPRTIAHRGFAGAYPENTALAAERAAAHDGVDMVEVDVVPTVDGTVVCFHDDHLHQTERSRGITDADGAVWETDTETVLGATVLDSDATVPRLETVLDVLPTGVGVNVELKNYGGTESPFGTALSPPDRETERHRWQPFVDDVVALLDDFDAPVLVSSFYEGALGAIRERAPEIPIGVLVWTSLADGFEIADRYDAEAIHPPWNLIQGTPFADETYLFDSRPETSIDAVSRAHTDGRDVNVWTVDTWYRADQLARVGVDGLIAEYPCIAGEQDWRRSTHRA